MNRPIAFTTALAATFLSGSTAWACISAMYGPAQTTPLDFLSLGVVAASISLLAMKADAPRTRENQLKRFGLWMIGSFLIGMVGSTSFGFELTGLTVVGAIGATTLLGGVMLPGLPRLRKSVLTVGMLFGFLGSLMLFLGEPQPARIEKADPAVVPQVTF